jgi:hypothetical protein
MDAAQVSIKSSQIVTVTVKRYLDQTGTQPVGANGTLTATADTAGYTSAMTDKVPAKYFGVTVANAASASAVISLFGIGLTKL